MGNASVAPKVTNEASDSTSRRKVLSTVAVTRSRYGKRACIWYYPNWESYLDENGNTYYYNDITKETKWDPRELEDIEADNQNYNFEWNNSGNVTGRSTADDQKLKLLAERAEAVLNDPYSPWKELCATGQLDFEGVESNVYLAKDILKTVSEGLYDPETVYQLPWAYKVQQLELAVRDCYLKASDFFDSSKYDNCNDVPRYDNGGLVAWWLDLDDIHMSLEVLLDSGVIGQESDNYTAEMQKLQEVAASGNEEAMLESFLARKLQVEKELSNLRARCFAVVSVEGGPTREALDSIYLYLKENVHADTDLADIQDEVFPISSREI